MEVGFEVAFAFAFALHAPVAVVRLGELPQEAIGFGAQLGQFAGGHESLLLHRVLITDEGGPDGFLRGLRGRRLRLGGLLILAVLGTVRALGIHLSSRNR